MRVYVVGPSIGYSRFIEDCVLVDRMEEAEVVLFTGGEDVNPEVYGCKAHKTTYFTRRRDKQEIAAFHQVQPNQLAVGVCRGVQLFCALYGGILVQDCSGHCGCGRHQITNGQDTYTTTSIHHQMQYPFELDRSDYEVLFWSKGISRYYEGDKINPSLLRKYGEPEVTVYHRKGMPTCFGVQGHPEMMDRDDPFVKMVNEKIREYVGEIRQRQA